MCFGLHLETAHFPCGHYWRTIYKGFIKPKELRDCSFSVTEAFKQALVMTVSLSVRVRPVSGSLLKTWLSTATDDFKVLILDCRSFLCYNTRHILDAYNVHCPLLLKRRSKGPLPLEYVVTCGEARSDLLAGFYQAILVYDEDSTDFPKEANQAHDNLDWVLETLIKETALQHSTEICFLSGELNRK